MSWPTALHPSDPGPWEDRGPGGGSGTKAANDGEGSGDGRPTVLVVSRCSRSFGSSHGGADVLARRHAVTLARSGLDVCLVTGPAGDLPSGLRVETVTPSERVVMRSSAGALNPLFLFNEFINVLRGARRGQKVLRHSDFDFVLCNHSTATLWLKLRNPRQFTIHYVHDSLHAHRTTSRAIAKPLRWFLNDLLEFLAARVADRIFCASEGIAEQLRAARIPPSKIVVAPALLSERWTLGLGAISGNLLGKSAAYSPYILSVGQQTGRKRFDLLIRAMKQVPPHVSLVLVGDGPLHGTYRQLVHDEGLHDRVRFLPGVADEELFGLYSQARLFALVSENEGFPVTVTEARSLGRPALVASPAAATWARETKEGLQLIPHLPSPQELGKSMSDLLEEPPPESVDVAVPRSLRDGPPGAEQSLLELYPPSRKDRGFPPNSMSQNGG